MCSLLVAEPRTGFHIAFKMLDVDENEQVDKKEFLKVRPLRYLDDSQNTYLLLWEGRAQQHDCDFVCSNFCNCYLNFQILPLLMLPQALMLRRM